MVLGRREDNTSARQGRSRPVGRQLHRGIVSEGCVTAASTWSDPVRPAAVVAVGWTGVVVAWQVRDTPWAITTASTQLVAVAVSVGAALLLHRRLTSDPAPSAIGGT